MEKLIETRTNQRAKPTNKALHLIRDILVILVIAIFASFMVKTFLIRSYNIPSGSMENTLRINDVVIVNELVPRVVPLQRGDVIVFSDPGGWLSSASPSRLSNKSSIILTVDQMLSVVGIPAGDDNTHLVKRVIGLPGDHVTCCNAKGMTSVNGVALNEPYTKQPPLVAGSKQIAFNVTVPKGNVWVEGDNRYGSADSRLHMNLQTKGFVPIKDIDGRAIVVSWPFAHWALLSDYPSVFANSSQH